MAAKKEEKRSRLWVFVVYPESLPENWLDIISGWHVPVCVSPLHDKDIDANGEQKKPHYHVVLQFTGNKSYEQIVEMIAPLNCPTPQRVNSLKGQVRYFLHQDNPEKAQYAKADLKYYGGFDPDLYLGSSEINRHIALREMREFIVANCIEYFCDLYAYADKHRPDWAELLDDSCSFSISTFTKDFRHELRSSPSDRSLPGEWEGTS